MRRVSTVLLGFAFLAMSCDSKPTKPTDVVVQVEEPSEPEGIAPAVVEPPPPERERPMEQPNGEFRFADDSSGRALAELLTPRTKVGIEDSFRRVPLDRKLPEDIGNPNQFSKLQDMQPTRLPEPNTGMVVPRALPDRVPFDLGGFSLTLPPKPELPPGVLTKVQPLFDVREPMPLPMMGRLVPDRAPLDDPTVEFTNRSVVRDVVPLRDEMASFLKFTLPDPFELSDTVRLRTPLTERIDSMPTPMTIPRTPLR